MWNRPQLPDLDPKLRRAAQRGQALLLLALAFVGLAAFIGLTVDAGILFSSVGQLRRAVDAASLAAANQFREGQTPDELSLMACKTLQLNGVSAVCEGGSLQVVAKICDLSGSYPSYHDATLCPAAGDPYTKEVRVEAEVPVFLAFLPIIGWDTLNINANATSEAASIDLVLVIDNSPSMAFDLCTNGVDDDGEGDGDDCPNIPSGNTKQGLLSDADPATCNSTDSCEPFEDVRAAALGLAGQMYYPYDRMGVITYSQFGNTEVSLANGDNLGAVASAINNMEVSLGALSPPCPVPYAGDPRGCMTTNTTEGLVRAGNMLADPDGNGVADDFREEAVWIVILLSDGGANAARDPSTSGLSPNDWICPNSGGTGNPTWVAPYCRDRNFEPFADGSEGYDAEDAAVDAALYVGCPESDSPDYDKFPECDGTKPAGGQGAVIFTIGLGDLMVNNTDCDPVWAGSGGCEVDQGEKLMRHIANIGEDGDPGLDTDLCQGEPTGTDCGNYFFAPTGADLFKVFDAIASRIFTRITQ